ncbi:hypothetical protein [Spiribacter onubensis]|uniref:Uncharacterized protein n=1 Tax=Spiribacter onubensis TaxID=3122420 RepID=A0ABV3S6S0_9GAMM
MHLRNREAQKVLSGLKGSGHFCVVRKPNSVKGLNVEELERRVDALIDEMREKQGG